MTPSAVPVSFEGFCDHLGRELDVQAPLSEDSRLAHDLELDSVQLLELLVVVEDLGVHLDEATVAAGTTLREVYLAYVEACHADDVGADAPGDGSS